MLDHKDTSYVELILADFFKSFDRMQASILVDNLKLLNIPSDLIMLANDFVHTRQQCVRLGATNHHIPPSVLEYHRELYLALCFG